LCWNLNLAHSQCYLPQNPNPGYLLFITLKPLRVVDISVIQELISWGGKLNEAPRAVTTVRHRFGNRNAGEKFLGIRREMNGVIEVCFEPRSFCRLQATLERF
jgi:hypothetical protein